MTSIATAIRPTTDVSTHDTLDHLFCPVCFAPSDEVIVSLCGRLRIDEPIGVPETHPCVVCHSALTCSGCGSEF